MMLSKRLAAPIGVFNESVRTPFPKRAVSCSPLPGRGYPPLGSGARPHRSARTNASFSAVGCFGGGLDAALALFYHAPHFTGPCEAQQSQIPLCIVLFLFFLFFKTRYRL